jgi:hypothetical protein
VKKVEGLGLGRRREEGRKREERLNRESRGDE